MFIHRLLYCQSHLSGLKPTKLLLPAQTYFSISFSSRKKSSHHLHFSISASHTRHDCSINIGITANASRHEYYLCHYLAAWFILQVSSYKEQVLVTNLQLFFFVDDYILHLSSHHHNILVSNFNMPTIIRASIV